MYRNMSFRVKINIFRAVKQMCKWRIQYFSGVIMWLLAIYTEIRPIGNPNNLDHDMSKFNAFIFIKVFLKP